MIQIDGIKRQVFIKFVDNESVHALLRDTSGRALDCEYRFGRYGHETRPGDRSAPWNH
jgi:hypothetical protein